MSATVREIGPREAREADALLVDVRSDEEWKVSLIPGALHVPMSRVEENGSSSCRTGAARSSRTARSARRSYRILPTLDALG